MSRSLESFSERALARVSARSSQTIVLRALYEAVAALPLGYNRNDDVSPEEVLRDGYGQCNTLTTLLCALSTEAGIPSRVHAYRLTLDAQRGRVPEWILLFAPRTTLFLWPEFKLNGKWLSLDKIVRGAPCPGGACPLRRAGKDGWTLKKEWIAEDLGVYSSSQEFFKTHKPTVQGWRRLGWPLARLVLNARVVATEYSLE